jgi:hypothetical protein
MDGKKEKDNEQAIGPGMMAPANALLRHAQGI